MEQVNGHLSVRSKVLEAVKANGIVAYSKLPEMVGAGKPSLSAAISVLTIDDKKLKRSVLGKEWYIREKTTPVPEGHVDKGYSPFVNKVSRTRELRAANAKRKRDAKKGIAPAAPAPVPGIIEHPNATVQMAIIINGAPVAIDLAQAQAVYQQLHILFGSR